MRLCAAKKVCEVRHPSRFNCHTTAAAAEAAEAAAEAATAATGKSSD